MSNPSSRPALVTRHPRAAAPFVVTDHLAVEEPLEIRVEGRSVALSMRTPGHDEELAVGFLLTEGVLQSIADVLDLDVCSATDGGPGNIINVTLTRPDSVDLNRLSRHIFTASSCGLCGKATIESVRQRCPARLSPPAVSAEVLLTLPARLLAAQTTFLATGGLHAAALFDATGALRHVREDVGRHNAVDKVLGRALLDHLAPAERAQLGLLVSGRIAFEIVQKALSAGIGLVVGVSAPTSLAVELAQSSGQTLVGFLRDDRFNVYAGQLDSVPTFSAVILAGGHSRRMGTDKASLAHPTTGHPQLLRQLDLVGSLPSPTSLRTCFVSARHGQTLPPLPPDVVRVDDAGNAGPLAGIAAALEACPTSHLIVVAVDLPHLDAASLLRLIAACGPDQGAVARIDTQLEPLVAVYPRRLLPALQVTLAAGQRGVQSFLRSSGVAEAMTSVDFTESPLPFFNWNTSAKPPAKLTTSQG